MLVTFKIGYIHKRGKRSVCVLDAVVGNPDEALGLEAEAQLVVWMDLGGVDH